MAKIIPYVAKCQAEKLPVVAGRQYRAEKVKKLDDNCTGCAAGGSNPDKALCEALPPCTKYNRLDGENVRYVDCGPAAVPQQNPVITTLKGPRGAVAFEHDIAVGTEWIHKPTGERVEVVDDGMAGMPEVKFPDGHTIYAFPQDLRTIKKEANQ